MFDEDAAVVQKLDKAGAILIGKLAMVELAGGGGYRIPSASLTGAALNPWDRTRWAGGSSSGSGAATAAGLVTFALGSETSGSIITPSAFCGVTGLRPTYGLVSRRGAMALAWTLDKIGPLCRSAEDCGLVLHVIAGADSRIPARRENVPLRAAIRAQAGRYHHRLRAGRFRRVRRSRGARRFQAALKLMKSLGMSMKEVEIPDFPYGALVNTIIGAEAASIFEDLIRSGKIDQLADHRQARFEGDPRYCRRRLSARHAHSLAGAAGVPGPVLRCRFAAGADEAHDRRR